MNALSPAFARSAPPGSRRARRRVRADQAFLPAALEVLETPPSPVGIAFLWIICLFTVAALTWCWFGRLDVVAVAQGKIQPTGRVKTIQPKEVGRVGQLLVTNGQSVSAGETLVVLDAGEIEAEVRQLKAALAALRAEADRRRAALSAAGSPEIEADPSIAWSADIPEPVRTREARVLGGDLAQLRVALSGIGAQVEQKRAEAARHEAMTWAIQSLVDTLGERVAMRESLRSNGSGSKADLIGAVEALQDKKTDLVAAQGQFAESRAAIAVLDQEAERTRQTFLTDNLQKLGEAERQVDDLVEQLAKAEARRRETILASPIAGTVSALSVTTPGQVVGAGEELMRIVPAGIGLEIEGYVANRDIGFVHPGQLATVKIESLPFTRYGTIEAELVRVAGDAIPQPEAEKIEGNPAQSRSERGYAGAQRTQNLVFPATLKPKQDHLSADGADVPLAPGMAVTIEIKTGSRRILEYLMSPLVEVGTQAMRER